MWEIGDDFKPMERSYQRKKRFTNKLRKREESAKKIQNFTRRNLNKYLTRKKAATEIQSRLRGNRSRRINDRYIDALLSVPYRDTDWKSMAGKEIIFPLEKMILKTIISSKNMDDIIEEIEDLKKHNLKTD